MIVKVDLSPEAKARLKNGQSFEIPGMWAIYYKYWLLGRWHKLQQQYADRTVAIFEAKTVKNSVTWI